MFQKQINNIIMIYQCCNKVICSVIAIGLSSTIKGQSEHNTYLVGIQSETAEQ